MQLASPATAGKQSPRYLLGYFCVNKNKKNTRPLLRNIMGDNFKLEGFLMVMDAIYKSSFVLDIKVWIDANLEKIVDIDVVVKKSGYSRSYLNKVFKEFSGETIGAYIRRKKIDYAVALMQNHNMSTTDLAAILQYDSCQGFIRAFKQVKKCTPGVFMKVNVQSLSAK